jgi:hypothetical protein
MQAMYLGVLSWIGCAGRATEESPAAPTGSVGTSATGGGAPVFCVGSLWCPLDEPVQVTRGFGALVGGERHLAVDAGGAVGDAARAACAGEVVYVGLHRGYGSARDPEIPGPVTLLACSDTSEPVVLTYGHCSGSAGAQLTRGEPVCTLAPYEGPDGSDWSHLHWGLVLGAYSPADLGTYLLGYALDELGWEGPRDDPTTWIDPAPIDVDGDGDPATTDCNDADPSVHAGALELCGDGVDNDCADGDACCPSAYVQCVDGHPSWFDSCGAQGPVAEVCAAGEVCVDVSATMAECVVPPAGCGDGTIDPGEQCDGGDLAGETCPTLGYPFGQLGCSAACTWLASSCARVDLVTSLPTSCTLPDGIAQDILTGDNLVEINGQTIRIGWQKCDGSPFLYDHDCEVRVGDYSANGAIRETFPWYAGVSEQSPAFCAWPDDPAAPGFCDTTGADGLDAAPCGSVKDLYVTCDEQGIAAHWFSDDPVTFVKTCGP